MSKIMVTPWSKRAFCYKTKRNTGTHFSSNFMENSCLAKPGSGHLVENGCIFCSQTFYYQALQLSFALLFFEEIKKKINRPMTLPS